MKIGSLLQNIPEYKETLDQSGIVIVRGIEPPGDEELTNFAESLSDAEESEPRVLSWNFGAIFRMNYDPNAVNYLFSAEKVPLHWDGPFYVEPRFLLFFCDKSTGEGGETIFVNTKTILGDIDQDMVRKWRDIKLTYRSEKKVHYGGTFTTNLVRTHPFVGCEVLRFCEVVETELNPIFLDIEGTDDPDGLYNDIASTVLDPRYLYRHSWQPGDVVIVDNHSYLHGREALGKNIERSFRRVHVM